jgi:predicted metal-dependent phosphoesterase TrpH
MIAEAKRIGLDGICLTDHNHSMGPQRDRSTSEKHQFLVLGGNEITTVQGDMVVFGLDEDIQGIIALKDLAEKVAAAGRLHDCGPPLSRLSGGERRQAGPGCGKGRESSHVSLVDGVETLNSKVTEE